MTQQQAAALWNMTNRIVSEKAPWYAVQTRPRCELLSTQLLAEKGYEVFYPAKGASGSAQRSVFPSYLFCRSTESSLGLIVTTPGVLRLLGRPGKPESVPDIEIAGVRMLLHSGLSMETGRSFAAGASVRIRVGPLCGLEGQIIRAAGRQRLAVSVRLLNRFVSVEVDPSWLEPRLEHGRSEPLTPSLVTFASGR